MGGGGMGGGYGNMNMHSNLNTYGGAPMNSSAPMNTNSDPEIVALFQQLSLQEFLPRVEEEGLTIGELKLLDESELKEIVPKLGPRKRLFLALQQDKAGKGSSNTGDTLFDPRQQNKQKQRSGGTMPSFLDDEPSPARSGLSDYHDGYNEGKDDGIREMKEKIENLKTHANVKFTALREEVEEERQKSFRLEEMIRKLKENQRTLKDQMGTLQEDKVQLLAKTKAYVAQTRDREMQNQQDIQAAVMKVMEKVFTDIKIKFDANDLYHGAQVNDIARGILREATKTVMKK